MKIVRTLIVLGLPLCAAACSAAPPTDERAGANDESTGTAEQAVDSACYQACMASCPCVDLFCRNCSRMCVRQCSNICFPNCAGQACGASDGCGGTCTANCLPDLAPSITGTLQFVGFNAKRGVYTIRIRNLGPVAAANVKILMETNLPAGLFSLTPSGGFACYLPSGYFPRLGIECVGGSVPAFGETVIQLTTSLSVSGANVLSIFADPDNTIQELFEGADNLTNMTLFVP